MRHSLTLALLLALSTGSLVHAQGQSRTSAQAAGAALGATAQTGKLAPSTLVTEGSAPGPANVWGAGYTAQPDATQTNKVNSGSMIGIGNQARVEATTSFKGYTGARDDQASQATYFLDKNPVLKPIISSSDPLFNTTNLHNAVFSSQSSTTCQQEVVKTKTDPDEIFKCLQSYSPYKLTCARTMTAVCGGGGDGCDSGGIVPGSWVGDMATTFTNGGDGNYILNYGTFQDNYWSGNAAVYDRSLTFSIVNTALISRFALTLARFDDWILVSVNGATIYVGPYGGDRLNVYTAPAAFVSGSQYSCTYTWEEGNWGCWSNTGNPTIYFQTCTKVTGGWSCSGGQPNDGKIQYCVNCFGNPELGKDWTVPLNIDMKPHLRNGTNTIFMRVIVSGKGEGALQMTTRQYCPSSCVTNWTDNCGALEGLAQ